MVKYLKKLQKLVKEVLVDFPKTRGDDDLLYTKVLQKLKVNLSDYNAKDFILCYRKLGIPTIETVGRCRRKIQAANEELKPTPQIGLKRKKLENSYYNYALGRNYKEV